MKNKVTERTIAIISGICASLILALSACGGSGGNALRDTTWELASLSGSDLLPGTTIKIEFAAAELSGTGGCNHYGGSYQVSGDSLSVSGLFATEMGCMEPAGVLDQESEYLAALGAADSYKIAGDRLEIYDQAGTPALIFVKPGASATPSVEATPVQSGELEKVERLAPIDQVEIQVDLSLPPQYSAFVASGLPNGCSEFDRLEMTAEGHTFLITIYNLETLGIPCTERYGTVEHNVALGSDLESGTIYTIQVNDVTETFTTQEGALPPDEDPTPTPEPTPIPEPPAGWRSYQDSATGVTVQIPESWVVTQILPNESAILQSYPEDKYIGGEGREAGDTKCDLTIRPAGIDLAGHMDERRSSPTITIVSEEEIVLNSGLPGIRLEVESMGPSVSLVTEVDERVIVLTCFGELAPFDEIAVTVTGSPVAEFPADFKPYLDATAGVMVHMPEGWIVTQIQPGQFAILQSYPEDKYVGGEAREPGDTKCDLTIRPADVDMAGHMDVLRSNPELNIISDQEIVLRSGQPGFRVEVESMGLSVSLITEVNERVVVLTCFGELARFDEIASTISAIQ